MKKAMRILLIIVVSVLAVLSIKPIFKFGGDLFLNFISYQFDKEAEERQKIYEEGGIVVGRDTMLVWKDMYVISNMYEGDILEIHIGKDGSETILRGVTDFKRKSGKLYVVARDGYAIIDKNNNCRIHLTTPKESHIKGYIEGTNGEKKYLTKKIVDTHVKYLDQFSSFTEKEQKVFNKMK